MSAHPFDEVVEDTLNNHDSNDCDDCYDMDILSQPITLHEIEQAIKTLKTGKSPGIDGIPPEFYKNIAIIVPYLLTLFTAVLDSGVSPESWNVGLIIPLYKKGDTHDTNSYRGKSLLNIMGKIIMSILECRIRDWLDINDTLDESQAGFCKGYSTTVNIFVLQTLCQEYLRKSRHIFYNVHRFSKSV